MTLHQRLFLRLLFPTLNHLLNPPYHYLIVDHLIKNQADGNNQQPTTSEVANANTFDISCGVGVSLSSLPAITVYVWDNSDEVGFLNIPISSVSIKLSTIK